MECLGRSQGQNPRGRRPRGSWPRDLPRHNINHDTSKAFSYNVIIIATRTSKEGLFQVGFCQWTPQGVLWSLYQEVTANIGIVKSRYTSQGRYNNGRATTHHLQSSAIEVWYSRFFGALRVVWCSCRRSYETKPSQAVEIKAVRVYN